MRTTIVGVALLTLFTATQAVAQGGSQSTGAGSGEAAVKQVTDAYVKASLAGDAKGIAALYTDDAVEMPPNVPSIKGRAAIEQFYTKLFAGGMKLGDFTLTHLESRVVGDTAYNVGTYQQSMTPAGASAATKETGKYVVILKRTSGTWKVAYAIYNSDQAPAH